MATRVVIAGGGVAALEAALALRALAEERVEVELLAPEPHFWYRPLSVAEPFELGETQRYELGALAAAAGATFTLGTLQGVDAAGHEARTSVGAIAYDVLLVAIGAVPTPAVPGALTFRGPADTDKIRALLEEIAAGEVRRVAFVVPCGRGLVAADLRARADDGGTSRRASDPGRRAAARHARGGAAPALRTRRQRGGARAARRARDRARDRLPTRPSSSTASCGSCPTARSTSTASSRCRGCAARGSTACRRRSTASSRSTRTGASAASTTSTPPATSRTSRSSRAASPPSMADAAAEAIAAGRRRRPRPEPFRPVLRGLLLTGGQPRYLRHELTGGRTGRRSEPGAALVAAGEDRRPLPRTLPRRASPASRARRSRRRAGAWSRSRSSSRLESSKQLAGATLDRAEDEGETVGEVMSPTRSSSRPRTPSARWPRRCATARRRLGGGRRLRPADRDPHLARPAARVRRLASIRARRACASG